VRTTITEPDERSQWEWWAMRRAPELELRNHGVYGERTDEIAARLEAAVAGADALVVQGGINDVAQGRAVEDAGRNLREMLARGRAAGLRVALADVLPWPNGDARAARDIVRLNGVIEALAAELDVPLLRFHDALVDPEHPERMRVGLTDDGDHPSVEGHRLLGELVAQSATSL
jgi:lysophospholipase L1-like esterase